MLLLLLSNSELVRGRVSWLDTLALSLALVARDCTELGRKTLLSLSDGIQGLVQGEIGHWLDPGVEYRGATQVLIVQLLVPFSRFFRRLDSK